MPTYNLKNNETGEIWTEFMKISELEELLANNPHITQEVSDPPAIIDSWHVQRVPGSFNDVLKKIKKQNIGSNIVSGNVSEV